MPLGVHLLQRKKLKRHNSIDETKSVGKSLMLGNSSV